MADFSNNSPDFKETRGCSNGFPEIEQIAYGINIINLLKNYHRSILNQ